MRKGYVVGKNNNDMDMYWHEANLRILSIIASMIWLTRGTKNCNQ
jgi:hypothetical protein